MTPDISSYRTLLGEPADQSRGAGAAADEPRRTNLTSTLACLHLLGPLSRSDLVYHLGLSRTTIGSLVGDLVQAGLAEESGVDRLPSPGRPSLLVRLRPERAVVVAIDVSPDHVAVATVGIGGRMFNTSRVSVHSSARDVQSYVTVIDGLVASQMSTLPAPGQIVGVGVAVHGLVGGNGQIDLAPNLGWVDVDLRSQLQAVFPAGTPVMVDNESTLSAVGEYLRGSLRGVANALLVSGNVGVGGGAIVNGRLLRGVGGFGGEVGHMVVNPGGDTCGCGSSGCWETVVGQHAIQARVPSLAGDDPVVALAAGFQAAAAGTAEGAAFDHALTETARWLGIGLANLINIFNPSCVVVGGTLGQLLPPMLPEVERQLDAQCLHATHRQAAVGVPTLGPDASLIGASELAFWTLLTSPETLLHTNTATQEIPNG